MKCLSCPAAREQTELHKKALQAGASLQTVTEQGYTQLPPDMVKELHLEQGGRLWFVRGVHQWEAWPEDQLEVLLGGKQISSDKK